MTARNGARMAGYDWAYVQGGRNVADSRTAGALCRFMSALVAAEGGENLRIGIVRARRNEATIESCDGSLASALAGAMSSAMHSGIEMSVPSSTSWLYVLAQEYRDKEIEVSGIVEYATLRGTIAEAACVDGSHLYVQVCAKRDGPAPLGPLHFLAEPTKAPWAVLAPVRSDADGCEEAEPRPAWVRSLESILRSISRSLVSERRIDDDEAERRDWVPIEKTQKHGRYVWRARCVQLPMTITGKANVLCLPRARCSHSARPCAELFSPSPRVSCLFSRTALRSRGTGQANVFVYASTFQFATAGSVERPCAEKTIKWHRRLYPEPPVVRTLSRGEGERPVGIVLPIGGARFGGQCIQDIGPGLAVDAPRFVFLDLSVAVAMRSAALMLFNATCVSHSC